MFLDSENNQQDKLEQRNKTRQKLLSIFSSQKALILVTLAVLSFALTTYYLISIIQLDLVIDLGDGETFDMSQFNAIYYISIVLSALIPIFLIGVYLSAKKGDASITARFFHYARIYMLVSLGLIICVAAFSVASMVGVLFVDPTLGFFVIIILAISFGLIIWIIRLITQFLTAIRDNLTDDVIIEKANPSKIIVLLWVVLVLTLISLLGSTASTSSYPYAFMDDLMPIINQMSLVSGIIGVISTGVLLTLLYEIRDTYTRS